MVHFQPSFFLRGKEVWNASTQLWLSENITFAVVYPPGFSGATSMASPKLSSPSSLTGSRTRLKETAVNFNIHYLSLMKTGIACFAMLHRASHSPEPEDCSQHAGKQDEQAGKPEWANAEDTYECSRRLGPLTYCCPLNVTWCTSEQQPRKWTPKAYNQFLSEAFLYVFLFCSWGANERQTIWVRCDGLG